MYTLCVLLQSLSSGGSDYTDVGPFTFTFNSTNRQFTFDVPLVDDDIFEITESLNATLEDATGAERTTQINCLDDDCKL